MLIQIDYLDLQQNWCRDLVEVPDHIGEGRNAAVVDAWFDGEAGASALNSAVGPACSVSVSDWAPEETT